MSPRISPYQHDLDNPCPCHPEPYGGVKVQVRGVALRTDERLKRERQRNLVIIQTLLRHRIVDVRLEHDYTNTFDKFAIKVWWTTHDLGFLPKELAFYLAPKMDVHIYSLAAFAHSVGRRSKSVPYGMELFLYDRNGNDLRPPWESAQADMAAAKRGGKR